MTSKRGAAKARKATRKLSRKRRLRRDARVTELYGEAGHRSCGKKARYASEESALAKATQYVALGAPRLRAYHCRFCGGWHLTKTEKRTSGKGDGEPGMCAKNEDYKVHEKTRRAAAIDARLGMGVGDIARSLGITEEVVERSVEEFGGLSDEELGMRREPEGDELIRPMRNGPTPPIFTFHSHQRTCATWTNVLWPLLATPPSSSRSAGP